MESSPGRTAMTAAMARGSHAVLDPPPWIIEDRIALAFVGKWWPGTACGWTIIPTARAGVGRFLPGREDGLRPWSVTRLTTAAVS